MNFIRKTQALLKSVHILLVDKRGRIMVCRRPKNASRYPNQMTSSAGGHVKQRESFEDAAKRELKEELGISLSLKDYGRFDVISARGKVIHHLFIGRVNKVVSPDPKEISKYYFKYPIWISRDVTKYPDKYAKPFHEAFKLYTKYNKL